MILNGKTVRRTLGAVNRAGARSGTRSGKARLVIAQSTPILGSYMAKTSPTPLSAEEIYRLIREKAYLKAEARQFAPGVELQDWLEAEKEVWQGLAVAGPKGADPVDGD